MRSANSSSRIVRRCFLQPLGLRCHLHTLEYRGYAGRQQLVVALDFNHAQPARAYIGQAIEVTERRNLDAILLCHFQDCLAGAGAYILAIDDQCFDVYGSAHANTSWGSFGSFRRFDVADARRAALVHDVLDVLFLK